MQLLLIPDITKFETIPTNETFFIFLCLSSNMVKEMTDKHLRAINRGRKDAGLKPIRRKKTKEKEKNINKEKLIAQKNKLIKIREKNRPKSTRRFVKDKKTGKITTKEFPNKAKDKIFNNAVKKIKEIDIKLYGKPKNTRIPKSYFGE